MKEGFSHSTITRCTGEKHYATIYTFIEAEAPSALLLISQYPIFDLQKHCIEKIISVSRKENIFTMEFYISLLFHYLSFNPKLKNYVEVVNANSDCKTLFSYCNFNEDSHGLSNHCFKVLFERINLKNIIKLLCLMFLERKIILLQDNDSELAIIIECLLELIYPWYFFL